MLWPLVVVLVVVLFRHQIRNKLGTITSLKVSAFEARFKDSLSRAQTNREPVPPAAERGAIGRAARARPRCEGKRILWVDDRPGNNHELAEVFKQMLGVRIDLEVTTDDGMRALRTNSDYAMIITDLARGDNPEAGLDLIRRMRDENVARPTIVYSGRDNATAGVPPGAFGLTNRADQLLHYVIDICERLD